MKTFFSSSLHLEPINVTFSFSPKIESKNDVISFVGNLNCNMLLVDLESVYGMPPKFLKGGSLFTSMFYNRWEDLLLGIDEVKDRILKKW
jgi:hypothetical protein